MLTPPKWQTLWLKSKFFSRNISNKIMFLKPAEKILDDICNCCNSASKELALEALTCWRIWIENQSVEQWKQNETCYSAVRPLATKKFHPLHKDSQIIEVKLSLIWLVIHKIKHFIQLEGPQFVLEVFIQSCVSWLSCSEDIHPDILNLMLTLLSSLFTNDVQIMYKKDSFLPLEVSLLQSNKLFSRLLPSFIEIFHNWTKIRNQANMFVIWSHFLGHCERSFKFVPVTIWHKTFKLVENICGDAKETLKHKLAVLHKCATSLKWVMYNSKFIDCSKLLTTPAEALMKLVIELGVNNVDEMECFEMFQYCKEISHVLCNRIIHTLGYDYSISLVPKIEEISSKSISWGLWCGLANCFKDQVENVKFQQYNKAELKMFRKLRSAAVNFDLDRAYLEEKSILMIQRQLNFLRIGISCADCFICSEKAKLDLPQGNHFIIPNFKFGSDSPAETVTDMESFQPSGHFHINFNARSLIYDKKKPHYLPKFSNRLRSEDTERIMDEALGSRLNNLDNMIWAQGSPDQKWLKCNSSFKEMNIFNLFLCHTEINGRLISNEFKPRRTFVIAPGYIINVLQQIIKTTRKNHDTSYNSFVKNIKELQKKANRCRFITPIKFCVTLKGKKGTKFCEEFLHYWEGIEDIVYDVDFKKNLNNLVAKNDNSIICFCMFAFVVNFTNNLLVQDSEENSSSCQKCSIEDAIFSRRITNFIQKVVHCTERFSKCDFIDSISEILPRNDDNPLVLWYKNNSAMNINKSDSHEKHINRDKLNEDYFCADDFGIFKYFDELQNKFSRKTKSSLKTKKSRGKKRKNNFSESEKFIQNVLNSNSVNITRTNDDCEKIWENKKVRVVPAPPDVFRSLGFSELSSEIIPKRCDTFRQNRKVSDCTLNKIQCETSESEPQPLISLAMKKSLAWDEVIKPLVDQISSYKRKGPELASSSRTTKENLPVCSKQEPYYLRRRQLKLPLQSKTRNKNFGIKRKSTVKKRTVTAGANKKLCKPIISNTENLPADNFDVMHSYSHNPNNASQLNAMHENFEQENERNKMEVCDGETVDSDIFNVVYSIIKAVEESELNCDFPVKICDIKSEIKIDPDAGGQIGSLSSPVTTKKRPAPNIDGNRAQKKIKFEYDAEEEINVKKNQSNLDVCPVEELIDIEEGFKTEFLDTETAAKKQQVPVVQSRGSKMLALIPESPKIEQYYETPSLYKHQTVKPHVNRNSRASKMLALLPKFQEVCSVVNEDNDEESGEKVEDKGKETRVNVQGKAHHLTRNITNSTITKSPKLSSLGQRRSIRFDDDKNETVTYFTQSPPCLLRFESRNKSQRVTNC